jgi:nitrate reductase delta subunit
MTNPTQKPSPLRRSRTAAHRGAIVRLTELTRSRFALSPNDAVMVAEVACALPGCPPIETVIVFWSAGERRHSFKIFKPAIEATDDDLPPFWMKDALLRDESADFCC